MRKFLSFIVLSFMIMNFCACNDFEEIPVEEANYDYSEESEEIFEEEEPTTTKKHTYNFDDYSESSYVSDYIEDEDIEYTEETTEPEETTEESAETTETTESTETTTTETETTTTEAEQTTEPEETTVTTTAVEKKKFKCIDVPFISQIGEYPTGCELVSASMLLKYYGFDVTAGELIDDGYIEKKELEKGSDNVIYCADPNKYFIGDPRTESGYGCYAPAIIDMFEKYLDGKFCDVIDLSGNSLDYLCRLYIDLGEPVIIWGSIDMKPTEKREDGKWTIKETNKAFNWLSNEHCLVLVGYDDENYYFNDPQKENAVSYRKTDVESRYKELGKQAVTIRPW